MKRNEKHLIRGLYPVGMLLQGLVRRYNKYGGTLNDADLRSLNYATERLNAIAREQGIPESLLHYPDK